MITYDEKSQVFHLATENTSYMIGIHKGAVPLHLYWGKRVYDAEPFRTLDAPYRRHARILDANPDEPTYTLEFYPQEYPGSSTDFRPHAYSIRDINGNFVSETRYKGYDIIDGKPGIEGLPAFYCEDGDNTQTLVLHLTDSVAALDIDLYYSVSEKYDVIGRHTEFKYNGPDALYLTSAMSVSIDNAHGYDEMIHLCGSALREKHVVRGKIENGLTGFESTRGVSSHQQTPFCALVNTTTTETYGDAWGLSLVYSGNFLNMAERDPYGSVRVQLGIHPNTFEWRMETGSTFATPEAILAYSDAGLNGMSQLYHKLFLERVSRGPWRDKERPILLNTWEACYFTFDHDRVMDLAHTAKDAGMELLVLDDGWFGHRDNAKSSLGDWYVDLKKLPRGLKALVDDVNALGLKFGIWFEPEMISPDSDLYRAHPDWCIHVDDRQRSTWRDQLYLDLTRDDVCDYIVDSLTEILSSANIEYVKWDNNRRMSEPGSDLLPANRKGEFYHRYVLNLYKVLETLMSRFPNILWENCSSGGARFDPGMMYYFSQNWASDDTDATERLSIQYGSSMLMPPMWITTHISACPNHQLARTLPLDYREAVCTPFNLGYELNMLELTDEEKAEVAEQVKRYKALRRLVQFGTFTRLVSPFDTKYCAWQTISEDASELLLCFYKPHAAPEEAYIHVKPVGLEEKATYEDLATGEKWSGSALMRLGLNLNWRNGEGFSQMWHFKKI